MAMARAMVMALAMALAMARAMARTISRPVVLKRLGPKMKTSLMSVLGSPLSPWRSGFRSSLKELQMMESKRSALLSRLELFRRSGNEPPRDLVQKVQELSQTWDQIKKLLSTHSTPSRVATCPSLLSAAPVASSGRCVLSPLTTSLLEQLESRIKELKSWLRDTELLIFNSCLRNDKEPAEQLRSFK
ncbi:A-kinase anchor protein 6-like, partial [Eucyclogobius newberryi]|uniref:A-kinase anchor protein 6-like n=1 Tax=Eucyclogobius newberryi TaxID=166745 RepID=UPI003B5916E0